MFCKPFWNKEEKWCLNDFLWRSWIGNSKIILFKIIFTAGRLSPLPRKPFLQLSSSCFSSSSLLFSPLLALLKFRFIISMSKKWLEKKREEKKDCNLSPWPCLSVLFTFCVWFRIPQQIIRGLLHPSQDGDGNFFLLTFFYARIYQNFHRKIGRITVRIFADTVKIGLAKR